jgi:hypothetical protein
MARGSVFRKDGGWGFRVVPASTPNPVVAGRSCAKASPPKAAEENGRRSRPGEASECTMLPPFSSRTDTVCRSG